MRGERLVLAAVACVLAAACEQRVRECGGGVEVVIAAPDVGALDNAGDVMWVTLDVGGQEYRREFDAAALGGGETSFTLDLDNAEPVALQVTVEIAYGGPGFYSGDVLWLTGASALDVPAASHGCLPMRIELTTTPDRDGDRVPDEADSCVDLSNPAQEDQDRDGVGDACDGCPMVANADQVDRDGDSVQDACDPCPAIAHQAMTDEDGDGIPDVCDPCPHLHGDRSDRDDDGVGDACDPRPDTGGDSIVAFLGFSDPSQLSQLTTIGLGSVTIQGGQLVIAAIESTAAILPRAVGLSGVVTTRVHQLPNTMPHPWGVGTIAWVDPLQPATAEPDGVVCMSHNAIALADAWPTVVPPVLPTMHDPDVVTRWSFIDEGSVGPAVALGLCTTDTHTATHDKTWSATPIYTGFGVIAYNAIARFDYLVIIDSP